MKIDPDKSKVMLFNTSKNWAFTHQVPLGNSCLEVVDEIKLLQLIITSDVFFKKKFEGTQECSVFVWKDNWQIMDCKKS